MRLSHILSRVFSQKHSRRVLCATIDQGASGGGAKEVRPPGAVEEEGEDEDSASSSRVVASVSPPYFPKDADVSEELMKVFSGGKGEEEGVVVKGAPSTAEAVPGGVFGGVNQWFAGLSDDQKRTTFKASCFMCSFVVVVELKVDLEEGSGTRQL